MGRKRELDRLVALAEDAARGLGCTALVAGNPGIGKTRLAEEIAERGASAGFRVFWGRGHEGRDAPAYWPWIQLVRGYAESASADALLEDMGAGAAEIARVVPDVRGLVDAPGVSGETSPTETRFRFFDRIAGLWRRASARQPLLLILDDLHWVDEASLMLLEFLSRELRGEPVLIVATASEWEARDEINERIAGLVRTTEHIALRGLHVADVGELMGAATGQAAGPDVVAAVHERTEGNPFFVLEITRLLGISDRAEDLAAAGPLPREIRSTIRRRVEPLAVPTRALLAAAAVVGREFDLGILREIVEIGAADAIEKLEPAERFGLVEPVAGKVGRFRFAHALVQETLYNESTPAERMRLHAAAGHALERRHGGAIGGVIPALARHFLAAAPVGEVVRAIDYAMRAGADAMSRLAYEEAAHYFENARDAFDLEPGPPERRLEIVLALALALDSAGLFERAVPAAREANALARVLERPECQARAALLFSAGGEDGLAPNVERIEVLEEALAELGDTNCAIGVQLRSLLAEALYFSDRWPDAVAIAEEAVRIGREVGGAHALCVALNTWSWAMWTPENRATRRRAADELVALANRSRAVSYRARAEATRLENAAEAGDRATLDASMTAYAEYSAEARLPNQIWRAQLAHTMVTLMRGDYVAAEAEMNDALQYGRAMREELATQWYALQLFILRRDQGRLVEIEPALRQLTAQEHIGPWGTGLARLLVESDRASEAAELLNDLTPGGAAAVARDVNWPITLAGMAQVYAAAGDVERCREVYDTFSVFDGSHVVVGLKVAYDGPAAYFLGLLATTLGDLGTAERHCAEAIAQADALGAEPAAARARVALARVARERGDTARAVGLEAEAREIAERIGIGSLRTELGPDDRASSTPARVPREAAPDESLYFKREGDYWCVGAPGDLVRLRDARGLHHIAALLRDPGRELHVLDLVGADAPILPKAGAASESDAVRATAGDAGEMLDERARGEYAQRLAALRSELDEAESYNDFQRAERLRSEIEFLAAELGRAVGLGGRARRAGSDAERARVNVRRTVGLALKKVTGAHPSVGALLGRSIRTGTFCRYEPDPARPIDWVL